MKWKSCILFLYTCICREGAVGRTNCIFRHFFLLRECARARYKICEYRFSIQMNGGSEYVLYWRRPWDIGGQAVTDGRDGGDQKDCFQGVSFVFSAAGMERAEAVGLVAGCEGGLEGADSGL